LTTISSQLFDFTPNIAYVFFSWNKLESVGRDLFTAVNVTQLGNLHFYDSRCIDRIANNQTDIVALISELQVSCPYNDEVLRTTTTTTPSIPTCFDGKIEDFVCEINENIGVV
jgi:hypothetical protein